MLTVDIEIESTPTSAHIHVGVCTVMISYSYLCIILQVHVLPVFSQHFFFPKIQIEAGVLINCTW